MDKDLVPELEILYETKDWQLLLERSSEKSTNPEIIYYRVLIT